MQFELVNITTSATLGLVLLAVIMQAINFVRIMRIEKKIKEKLDDLCLRE